MADRKQTTLPIIGIDTSSPDHNVKDGKCSVLHNLRYAAGAWRNVHPFAQKRSLTYEAQGVTYYAWKHYNDSSKIVYSLKNVRNTRRGDALYIKNEVGAMLLVGYVQLAGSNMIYRIDTKPENDIYAWSNTSGTGTYYTLSESASKGDTLYDRCGENIQGKVISVIKNFATGQVQLQATITKGEPTAIQLTRIRRLDWTKGEHFTHERYIGASELDYTPNVPEIVYHHPADAANRYVVRLAITETSILYAWKNTEDNTLLYTTSSATEPSKGTLFGDADDVGTHYALKPPHCYMYGKAEGEDSIILVKEDPKYIEDITLFAWAESPSNTADAVVKYYTTTMYNSVTTSAKPGVLYDAEFTEIGTYNNIKQSLDKEQFFDIKMNDGSTETVGRIEDNSGNGLKDTKLPIEKHTEFVGYYGISTNDNLSKIAAEGYNYYLEEINTNGELSILQKICPHVFTREEETSLAHFGKMLIIKNDTKRKMHYFFLHNGRYLPYDSENVGIDISLLIQNSDDATGKAKGWVTSAQWKTGYDGVRGWYREPITSTGGELALTESQNEYWRGEIAYFVALRASDGSIIKMSPVHIYSTFQQYIAYNGNVPTFSLEKGTFNDESFYKLVTQNSLISGTKYSDDKQTQEVNRFYLQWKGSQEKDKIQYGMVYNCLFRPSATIRISDSCSDIMPVIADIAVYSTRIHTPLDVEKIVRREQNKPIGFSTTTDGSTQLITEFFAHNDLPNEPFYRIKTIPIAEVKNGEYKFDLDYGTLQNAEHEPLFEPALSAENLYGRTLVEYNNCLHLLNVTQRVRADVSSLTPAENDTTIPNVVIRQSGTLGLDARYALGTADSFTTIFPYYSIKPTGFANKQPYLICTDDSSDNEIMFIGAKTDDSYPVFKRIGLSLSSSLAKAFFINYATSGAHPYSEIVIDTSTAETSVNLSELAFTDRENVNRIQVSIPNNCLTYSYENSYYIGSDNNAIIAANSAAIEMSDAKFGEFPLYVFTEEGVFAMQSGTETLYSAIVPIAYDKAISPNTLAVNYNVLFVTARGLMALSSRGLDCLSAELNTVDNLIPEFLRTASLVRLPKYNEVMVFNTDDPVAYIYSLDNKVWSSRDISNGSLLNNNEMVVDKSRIIDITDETDNAEALMSFEIDTRCAKFGSMELKRVETLAIRFESASAQCISVEIYGSVNLNSWTLIRSATVETNKDIIIRRVPMSAKYLRFRIYGATTEDIKILPLDVEYYFRMLHRMR